MTDEDDKKKTGQESGGSEGLPQDEYDRLVQGCEEFYFGPGAEPEGGKKPTPKTTDEVSPKDGTDAG